MTLEERFDAKFIAIGFNGCWEWTGARSSDGYGSIGWNGKMCGAHRISWELHNGPIPDGLCVLHTCDNPGCVNPDHLWLGTQKDNAIDRENKGRGGQTGPLGERARAARLTADKVKAIRHLAKHMMQKDVAELYGVHKATINDVVLRKTWRHVA